MAKFQVARHFPSAQVLRVGDIVEDPQWRNLGHLIKQGYVKEMPDELPEKKVAETKAAIAEPETPAAIAAKPKAARKAKAKKEK